ncbi:acyl-CoA dehydrogenase family protein [Saccharopolyspora spinosporotrichia]
MRHLLRDFFAETSSPEDIRKHVESARGHDEVQWRRLAAEIGVQCLVVPEEYGGAGYSFTELAVVLGEAGRALCCAPLLPTLALAVQALLLSGDDDARARYLPGIAEGETTATVAGFGDETEVVAEPHGRVGYFAAARISCWTGTGRTWSWCTPARRRVPGCCCGRPARAGAPGRHDRCSTRLVAKRGWSSPGRRRRRSGRRVIERSTSCEGCSTSGEWRWRSNRKVAAGTRSTPPCRTPCSASSSGVRSVRSRQ